ncbi:MAG TPA: hypothetical protein VHM94_16495 [Acidimicrobiia bacterium]|nr:hypothetical protein [Acidimicrobiia bacterium]
MSQAHKAALAQGRRESKAISNYLGAIESRRPGRKVTRESLETRLAGIDERIAAEQNPLKRVELVQSKLDSQKALQLMGEAQNEADVEKGFVENAASYSERKGITYGAWREAGVPAAVLKKAGIARTRG